MILEQIVYNLGSPTILYNVGSSDLFVSVNCLLHQALQIFLEIRYAKGRNVLIVGQLIELFINEPNRHYGLSFCLDVD